MKGSYTELNPSAKIHIRPAQLGNICLLLEPIQAAEIGKLRQHQATLQTLFGGEPIEEIHLTCQRFECRPQMLGDLITGLEIDLRRVASIELRAVGIESLPIPVRQTTILKWRVEISKTLEEFVAIVTQRLVATVIQPLYTAGFVSSLVAALKGIAHDQAQYGGLPYSLFTGEKVILSRIEGANTFDLLATIYLGKRWRRGSEGD